MIIRRIQVSPREAFDLLMDEAESSGLQVTQADREARHIAMRLPGARETARLSVACTDSGFEDTIVHVDWEPPSLAAGRRARRLLRRIGASS
jgi:hypothetical protein